jgi:hypothetical protein
MPAQERAASAPTAEEIRGARALAFAPPADADAAGDHARQLGILLDGLVIIAAGRVHDEAGQPLTLARVIAQAAAHEPAAGWQVERRPFLAELARRVLALGLLDADYPDEDLLLNPRRTRIDPDCADAPLAFARAVTALELQSAELLAAVVARHLEWRAREDGAGRPQPALPWLGPLLEDLAAQCLLVGALAGGERAERLSLWRRFAAAYEAARAAEGWPAGPLAACCALGLLLRRPREGALVAEFRQRVADWPGWQDEDAWPTRHPGASLSELQARLTEQAADALGVAERKLWPRAALAPLLEGSWPALLSFCFTLTPRAPADGTPKADPQGRGERDEPHP